MATVTISLSGSTVINGNKSWTISDADVQTLITSIQEREVAAGRPNPTNAQALVIWAQGFIDVTVENDFAFRRTKARLAVAIPPLVFT